MKSEVKIDVYGNKRWYLNGKLHRADGPAIISGRCRYWYFNGLYHRVDGPAVEYPNGSKYWWFNGEQHREDGPAVEKADGTKQWYYYGKKFHVKNIDEFKEKLELYFIEQVQEL